MNKSAESFLMLQDFPETNAATLSSAITTYFLSYPLLYDLVFSSLWHNHSSNNLAAFKNYIGGR